MSDPAASFSWDPRWAGRFRDGRTATGQAVEVRPGAGGLEIRRGDGGLLAEWPYGA